jgi:hypothetical protein
MKKAETVSYRFESMEEYCDTKRVPMPRKIPVSTTVKPSTLSSSRLLSNRGT